MSKNGLDDIDVSKPISRNFSGKNEFLFILGFCDSVFKEYGLPSQEGNALFNSSFIRERELFCTVYNFSTQGRNLYVTIKGRGDVNEGTV